MVAHRIHRFLIVVAGVLGTGTTAAADERIEIVPYAGYRTGGDFEFEGVQQHANVDSQGSVALALNLDIDANSQYQVYFSRQATRVEPNPAAPGGTDLDIAYLHLGGTLTPDTSLALKPYLVGTLGATWFSPDAIGAHDSTQFSSLWGAGYEFRCGRTSTFFLRPEGSSLFFRTARRSSVAPVRAAGHVSCVRTEQSLSSTNYWRVLRSDFDVVSSSVVAHARSPFVVQAYAVGPRRECFVGHWIHSHIKPRYRNSRNLTSPAPHANNAGRRLKNEPSTFWCIPDTSNCHGCLIQAPSPLR